MKEADPVGLTALVEGSGTHSSIRIVSNDVTITPAHSGKKQLPGFQAEVWLGSIN